MLADVTRRLRQQGFAAHAAVADTPGAAHALARFAEPPRVPEKIAALKDGRIPIYEPGLDALVADNVRQERLAFTTNLAEAVAGLPDEQDLSLDPAARPPQGRRDRG